MPHSRPNRRALGARLRYDVLRRCNFACYYCGLPAQGGLVELQIEHVIPLARGGTDDPWNLVAACRDCNAGKTDTMPPDWLVRQVAEHYDASGPTEKRAQLCSSCGRIWLPHHEDLEPNDQCWACIASWCEGMEWGRAQGARA